MKKILTYLAATIACGYVTIATAQPITFNLDIGAPADKYNGLAIAPDPAGGTNWNNLALNTGAGPVTVSNLVSSIGTVFLGVNVSMFAAGNSMHHFNATAPTVPNPLALMRDYSFFRVYTVTVSGLEAGNYEMYFYGHGDQQNQQGVLRIAAPYGAYTNQTCNCADGRNITAGEGIGYLRATNLTVGADGLFVFRVGGALSQSGAGYMTGFQLRPSQPQGPAFVVTGADGCSDVGVTPGIAGSVTTNDYMLYLNGAYVGPTIVGTGSALNFGLQTNVGDYTIVGTNSATATSGLMYGSVRVYAPGVTINTQPTSVSVVSNLPTSLSVVASGDSLTYQWYKDGTPVSNGGTISGAQTPTLSISAVQPSNAGNYTVVVQNPCSGAGVTSAPPAVLTITAPRNLTWVGGVVGSDWNFTDQEFTDGSATAFSQGDKVTFDDSSLFQSVTISNNLTPTLVTVTGTKAYTFSGPNKITGVSGFAHSSSGTLTILNGNDATGSTTIASGSTLQLGDGTATGNGSLAGTVTINSGANLNYNFGGSGATAVNLAHSWSGGGTIDCTTANGAVINTPQNAISSSFNGIININGFTTLHPSGVGGGVNMLGFGSTVNLLTDGGQLWIDPPASGVYSNVLNIIGNGRVTDVPALGAIRIFNSTLIGHINLLGNTRIGGSISGGTIRSTIAGPYQLEVLGTTLANYVLQLGPTNGTHSYSSTLITAGTVQALNNNAISTGPLAIDNAGTLRLNGNTLSVSNLTSLNTLTVAGQAAPFVRNNHATLVGTLIVGTDDTSTTFDGIFGNGAAAALGLTKVGAGTLTLSQISTNTGTVAVNGGTIAMTGSGAFTSASVIVGSGAFYDVTGAGGTATFGTGQTLGGNGTVTGNVVANSGSTIAPGTSVGTLTVSGNITLGGNLVMEMNRTNTPNNSDRLLTSGGSITGGGTLTNVNIGPALQVGDTFQFFASGVSGITANLQTVDYANAVTYTWNNNIAVNGTVSVASATAITPPTLGAVQTGNTVAFSWTGPFKLQAQTNNITTGISNNWFNYPGGSVSPINVTINPTNRTVFYRLSLQ